MVLASAQLYPNFPPKRGGHGRNRAEGLDKLPYGVNSGPHSVTLGIAAEHGLGERTKWGKPQKRRGKYFGSTVEGAEPLSPALLALYRCLCCIGIVARTVQSGKAGEARSLWLLSCVAVGWGEVPKQPSG